MHQQNRSEMRRALEAMHPGQLVCLADVATTLEVPDVLELTRERVQRFVQPDQFLAMHAPGAHCGYTAEESATLFSWFPHRNTIRDWLGSVHDFDLCGPMKCSPDRSKIATLDGEGLAVWDIEKQTVVCRFSDKWPKDLYRFAWSSDSRSIVTCNSGNSVKIWNAQTGEKVRRLGREKNEYLRFNVVAWNPDGTKIAGGTDEGMVRIWDVQTGDIVTSGQVLDCTITEITWSADGAQLACASLGINNTAGLFDVQTSKVLQEYEAEKVFCASIAFSADAGKVAVYSAKESNVSVYEAPTKKVISIIKDVRNAEVIVFNSDGTKVAVLHWGNEGKDAGIWDAQTGELLVDLLYPNKYRVNSLVWSPDGRKIAGNAYGEGQGFTLVWDAQTGRCIDGQEAQFFRWDYVNPHIIWVDSKRLITKLENSCVLWPVEVTQQIQNLTLDQGLFLSALYKCYKKQDGSKVELCLQCKPHLSAVYDSFCAEIRRKINPYITWVVECVAHAVEQK